MDKVHKIKEIKHFRLLSDPLKLKLLQTLAEEQTVRQIAERMNESVTKLYRHVDALLDAGLIEVVQETPKRGTVERSFRAVAKRFEVDSSLLDGGAIDSSLEPVRDLLRDSESEILGALADPGVSKDDDMILARLRVQASPAHLARLRSSLNDWLEHLQLENEEDEAGDETAGVLIAFYPVKEK